MRKSARLTKMERGKCFNSGEIMWTESRLSILYELCREGKTYREMSEILGVNLSVIYKKVKRLGIYKEILKNDDVEKSILDLLNTHSYQDIANIIGVSKRTVLRVVKKYNFVKSKDIRKKLFTTKIKELRKSESRRVLFGLEQKSKLKVVTNKKKIRLRYSLKKRGYICDERGGSILKITGDTTRSIYLEKKGSVYGFQFLIS